jgi:Ni/Co efflux regulator RcnB
MRMRLLFLTLIAVAMALAPLAMPVSDVMAAPAGHHQAMAKAGHCPEAPKPSHHHQAEKSCCVAGCMALAALPVPAGEPALHGATRERPEPDQFRRGYLGEIATPPPRLA